MQPGDRLPPRAAAADLKGVVMPYADPEKRRTAKRESERRRRARAREATGGKTPRAAQPLPQTIFYTEKRGATPAPAPDPGPGPVAAALEQWLTGVELEPAQIVLAASARQLAARIDQLAGEDSAASGAAVAGLHARLADTLGVLAPTEAQDAEQVARRMLAEINGRQ